MLEIEQKKNFISKWKIQVLMEQHSWMDFCVRLRTELVDVEL